MLCSISGQAPQQPVASSKSGEADPVLLGNIYEKRLIEAYIAENHKDPVNGEDLELTDLIDLKSAHIVTPRPPTLTSIPALLSAFQTEWDATTLEAFNLRHQLNITRQELATALYQHDAATRVIARLTKERDESRDALSKVTVGAGVAGSDAMQIDSSGIPEHLVLAVQEAQVKLSKGRRKRTVPKDWVNAEAIGKFGVAHASDSLSGGANFLALDETSELAIVGGADGYVHIYSVTEQNTVNTYRAEAAVTDAVWYGKYPVVSTTLGTVHVFGKEKVMFTAHAGRVNSIDIHPTCDILASVGVDKSLIFYDLEAGKAMKQVYTDSELTTATFHPDGHVFAAGGADGQIKMFYVENAEKAAIFELGGPVQDLVFSENGIWFAAVAKGSTTVVILDIRKPELPDEVRLKELEIGGPVDTIDWDYTGQYVAAAGPRGLTVVKYTKSNKSWSDVISNAVPAVAIRWGSNAKTLVTVNKSGVIAVLGEI
ncbi:hypothetical protein HYALB_00007168 [Hymenoscyphus albidus]|uniref:Pre-mRNA-processing factor 19 n=1 Tax=Hymenoscyphus albidus TaxID=595503 RepID=A0A9N9M079_9HELO|nr:hypothetical protein HYALB_00007168 [Hymenoscyphus albidus]